MSAIVLDVENGAPAPALNLSTIDSLPYEKPQAAEKYAGAAPAESEQF